ncbi:hypothetical protein SDC9_71748 [bioreactor metagenome]|uniref:Uncharacterized protein n=1 Tax=bioreactor metagenome TaxID=1076179 RepID=A0A644YBC4_9ZZZZ
MLAFNSKFSFIFNSTDILSKLIPVALITGTSSAATVTSHTALKLPSFVVTVIVAFPSPTAVTFPFSSTFATFSSLVSQVTSLFVASAGEILAFNSRLSFIFNSDVVLSKVTPVAFTASGSAVQLTFIVISLVACEALPSSVYQGKSIVSCVGFIPSLNSLIPDCNFIPSTYTLPYLSIALGYNSFISSPFIVNLTPYGTLAFKVNSLSEVSYSISSP